MRRTRQLPTEHIKSVTVISEREVKKKKKQTTYSTWEMVKELLADVSVRNTKHVIS